MRYISHWPWIQVTNVYIAVRKRGKMDEGRRGSDEGIKRKQRAQKIEK